MIGNDELGARNLIRLHPKNWTPFRKYGEMLAALAIIATHTRTPLGARESKTKRQGAGRSTIICLKPNAIELSRALLAALFSDE